MEVRFALFAFLLACAGSQRPAPQTAEKQVDPVVAVVHGERILASELDVMLHTELLKLDNDYTQRRYDMRRQGLDAMLFRKLVEHEAAAQKLDPETYLAREVESKLVAPDEPELRGFYLEHADKLAPLTFADVRAKLVEYLMQQRRSEMVLGLYARLKAKAHPTISLDRPTPVIKQTAAMVLEQEL